MSVQTTKLRIPCPGCGSFDVFYSCSPACCFNHVCADCRTTFEPVTVARGGKLSGIVPPVEPGEAADPAVACVRCDSTAVYMTAEGPLVCSACGSLLDLELTEITVG